MGKFLSPFERRLASSARDYNRYVHRLCMYLCTSLYEYITMAFKGCHSVKGLCRHCMFYPRTKLKRFTNGCRTWRLRCSLGMQLGNNVLLFNGVNQISANGKKGKTLHKSWQSRKNRMTELLDINYRGVWTLMAGGGSISFHDMAKWSDVCCVGKRETVAYSFS